MATVNEIDELLPQTQCGECGYSGCRPYAQALVQGVAPIDRCPPGGVNTLKALGERLNIDVQDDWAAMETKTRAPSVATIRESECIGCTKCIQACPVDAIVGSSKLMHSVIDHECTGCGLCVEPCPVDCIDMQAVPEPAYDKDVARARFHAREVRILREKQEKERLYQQKRKLAADGREKKQDKQAKQDFILQALARVKAKQG